MKLIRTFLLLFGCICCSALYAQEETGCPHCPKYDAFMSQGKDYFNQAIFDKALVEFQAAQVAARACRCNTSTPSIYILEIFKGIQKQRDDAILSQKRAEKAEVATKKALVTAEQSRIEAERQRAISQRTLKYFFKNDSTASAAWGLNFGTGKYGIINRDGEILGDGFVWENPTPFMGDYAIAEREGERWFVNKLGEVISDGYENLQRAEFPLYYLADGGLIFYNGQVFESLGSADDEVNIKEHRPRVFPFKEKERLGFMGKDSVVWDTSGYDIIEMSPNGNKQFAVAHHDTSWQLIDLFEAKIIDSLADYNELLAKIDSIAVIKGYLKRYIPELTETENSDSTMESVSQRFRIKEVGQGFSIVNFKEEMLLDTIYEKIEPFVGDSIFILVKKWHADSAEVMRLFNASNRLYSPYESEFVSSWWNGSVIVGGPTDQKEDVPKYDYSMYYEANGEAVPTINFRVYEIELQNQDMGLIKTKKMNDKSAILVYAGEPINKRLTEANVEFWDGCKTAVYTDINYKYSEKQGIMKADGSILTPPVFDEINFPKEGKYLAKKGDKWGYINEATGWILPFVYDSAVNFYEGRAAVRLKDRWGYIGLDGTLVAPCVFEEAYDYTDNRTYVKQGGKWGSIDYAGKWLIKPEYDGIFGVSYGAIPVKKGGKWGYVDTLNRVIYPFSLEDTKYPADNGWARMKKNGKWGYLNIKNFQSLPVMYDTVTFFVGDHSWVKKDTSWHMINASGTIIRQRNDIKEVDLLDNGFTIITCANQSKGVLDSLGQEIVPCNFSEISFFNNDNILAWSGYSGYNKATLFDRKGKILKESIETDGQYYFMNGLMKTGEGIINRMGELLLKGRFDKKLIGYRIYELYNNDRKGYAAFSDFGTGIDSINQNIRLKRYLPTDFEEIGFPIDQEWMPVKKNGKWGFIHWIPQEDGSELAQMALPCQYDAVVPFIQTVNGKIACVSIGYETFFIDEKGKILFDADVTVHLDALSDGSVLMTKGLTVLDWSDRGLSAISAEDWNSMKHVKELNLSENRVSSLSDQIYGLKRLITLNLSGNQLDSLPEQIVQLKNLEKLILYNNPLKRLPEKLFELTNLTRLDLQAIQIESLSEKISNLTSLEWLDLSENKLASLPAQFGELVNLYWLDLHGNQFSSLPDQVYSLEKLTFLGLSGNQLSSLPDQILKWQNLQILDLRYNQLNTLPEQIKELKKLSKLNLQGNPISKSEQERIQTLLPDCSIIFEN